MLLTIGLLSSISVESKPKEINEASRGHSLPIKETITFSLPLDEVLIPMPIGEIDLSAEKVKSTRNPFKAPSNLESTNLDLLNSAIQFSGIAKSGDLLVVIIRTDKGQKAYKVGDSLGNGFIVKSISSKDVTVDISNGSRSYRLGLQVLNP